MVEQQQQQQLLLLLPVRALLLPWGLTAACLLASQPACQAAWVVRHMLDARETLVLSIGSRAEEFQGIMLTLVARC